MGCDIHLYVEHRRNSRWWKCKDGFKSDYYKEGDKYFSKERFENGDSPYMNRNYVLFGYLADVRNSSGFAGCDTGDAIKPIAQPRGLPSDISLSIKEESDGWDCDGHSHSYFTLGELKKAYQQAKKIKKIHRGVVNVEEYKEFKKKGKPSGWCGGVSGSMIKHISIEEMDKRTKDDDFANKFTYYTKVEWTVSLADDVKDFFDHVIPQLEKWDYEDRKDDEIRIVFWFDN